MFVRIALPIILSAMACVCCIYYQDRITNSKFMRERRERRKARHKQMLQDRHKASVERMKAKREESPNGKYPSTMPTVAVNDVEMSNNI